MPCTPSGLHLIATHDYFLPRSGMNNGSRWKTVQINQLETELKYLRAQVNPHFLFNGLNTIYGYIDRSNQQARDILVQFSDLLRYSLYDADVDWVDLGKEAVYLQNYVALQRARSNSNLQIELEISVEENTVKIAPLLFMAFRGERV
jgi:two-component system LytT family sensor kinase